MISSLLLEKWPYEISMKDIQRSAGPAIVSPAAGVADLATGGKVTQTFKDVTGETARERAGQSRQRAEQASADIYNKTRDYNSEQAGHDDQYYNRNIDAANNYKNNRNASQAPYLQRMDEFDNELKGQATMADQTYMGSVKPGLTELMGQAQRDSRSAMSLEEYMDPNNRVAKGVRDMYEQQAQGVGRQGLADTAMLQQLGAQAASSQMGGMPMTTGGMQALYSANQGQAGQAYARTQQQMQSLREQGIDRGFDQSDKAYAAGVDAQGRYRNSLSDLSTAENDYFNKKANIRGERGDIAGQKMGIGVGNAAQDFGLDTGLASQKHTNQSNDVTRRMTTDQQQFGSYIAQENANIARQNASAEGKAGQIGQITGVGGAILGGIYGGPQGAAAGYQAGNSLGYGASGGGGAGTAGAPQGPGGYGFTGQGQGGGYGQPGSGYQPYNPFAQQQYNPNSYNPAAYGGFAGMGAR